MRVCSHGASCVMMASRDPHPATPTITPATLMTSRCIPPNENTRINLLSVAMAIHPLPRDRPVADSLEGKVKVQFLLLVSHDEKWMH